MNNIAQQAVKAALNGDWDKAIDLNNEILASDPKDTDALNRLARALFEAGNVGQAKKQAEKVLKIDPFNSIAAKSLAKWRTIKTKEVTKNIVITKQLFLEEPGKTKIVSLINIGDPETIAALDSGNEVSLTTHGHRITVCSLEGKYIGRLPDNISTYLKNLISQGNKYDAHIKAADDTSVKIFIREIVRSERFKNTPSFPLEKTKLKSFSQQSKTFHRSYSRS